MAAPKHHHKSPPKPKEPTDGVYNQVVQVIRTAVVNQRWNVPKEQMAQALDNVKGQLDHIYRRLE